MKKSKLFVFLNKALEFCYYSLFIFTPLIMTSITSELFEFNKMLFIYLITTLTLFFWLVKMVVANKIIIKKTFFDIPILIFFLSQLLSTLFSVDRHTSIFGYYGRFNGGLLSTVSYIILYYAFVSNYQDFSENFLSRLLKTIVSGSLIVILWGLPGRFGYDFSCFVFAGQLNNNCWTNQFRPAERLFSTLGQPNWLGAYLAVCFFIGIYFFFKTKDTKYWILNTIYLLLNFITLLFTRSRSSLMATGVGFLLFIFLALLISSKNIKKILTLGLLMFFSIVIFKTGIPQVDKFFDWRSLKKEIKTVSQTETKQPVQTINSDITESGDIRRIVWKGALELGKQYPIFGTGVETFAYAYYFVRPKDHNLTSEWDYLYNKAHNEYLNYLATTGFIGLISYLIMIGTVLYFLISNIKDQRSKTQSKDQKLLYISLLGAYLSILITNFFGFSITVVNLFFYLIPAVFVIEVQNQSLATDQQLLINNNQLKITKLSNIQKTFIFILLASSFYFLTSIYRYWLADINYTKGDTYSKLGQYQEAANFINKALSYKYEHVYQDKLSSVLANLAFISAYQKQTDLAKKLVYLSKFYNEKSLQASPKNVLYWKTKAKNYYFYYQISQNIEDVKKGIDALKESRSLAPTDPKIPYSLAIFYSLLYDEAKSLTEKNHDQTLSIKEINNAIDLKSNDRGYYLLKGQLHKKFSNREEARETFQFILDKFNPQDEEVKKEINSL